MRWHCSMGGRRNFPSSGWRVSERSPRNLDSRFATSGGFEKLEFAATAILHNLTSINPVSKATTLISRSAEETSSLGEVWGRELESGWVVGLSGDLGAGKTQLVKGVAAGIGIQSRITSPTFNLIHIYE